MKGEVFNVGDEVMNMIKFCVVQLIQGYVKGCVIMEFKFGEDKDKRDYEVFYQKICKFGFNFIIFVEEGIKDMLKIFFYIVIIDVCKFKNV